MPLSLGSQVISSQVLDCHSSKSTALHISDNVLKPTVQISVHGTGLRCLCHVLLYASALLLGVRDLDFHRELSR